MRVLASVVIIGWCAHAALTDVHAQTPAQAPVPPAAAAPAPPQPNPAAPMYRQKGEQYRIYNFPGTGESFPAQWDPKLGIHVT